MNETSEPPRHPPLRYRLQLFVAGMEPNSQRARENLTRLCQQHLDDGCEIEVVDVLQDYRSALERGVLVAPTLVVNGTDGAVMIVGDLSDERQVLPILQHAAETHGE